jgi:hypothetical protein
MLKAHEELWEMELGDTVEKLVQIPSRKRYMVV